MLEYGYGQFKTSFYAKIPQKIMQVATSNDHDAWLLLNLWSIAGTLLSFDSFLSCIYNQLLANHTLSIDFQKPILNSTLLLSSTTWITHETAMQFNWAPSTKRRKRKLGVKPQQNLHQAE